jgi:hypothetical protein
MEEHGSMLSVFLYDTNSVQDRLYQRSQPSNGEAEQTVDGKVEQSDVGLLEGSRQEVAKV